MKAARLSNYQTQQLQYVWVSNYKFACNNNAQAVLHLYINQIYYQQSLLQNAIW